MEVTFHYWPKLPLPKPLLCITIMHMLAAANLPLIHMEEWGPSTVTEAEIQKMEEDGLAP